jgi:hypothetical protein
VLAKLQPGTNPAAFAARYGLNVGSFLNGMQLACLQGAVPGTEPAVAAQLAADPAVVYAEPEASTASPEVSGNQFHFPFDITPLKTGLTTSAQIKLVDVGMASMVPNMSNISVAVIDTGVQTNHPLLAGHLISGYNVIQPGAPPSEAQDGVTNDAYGHGTMIAGIIAAVAPTVSIMPVRVLNGDGVGTVMNLITGIQWAASQGADVINLSLGTTQPSQALADAIAEVQAAGIVVVASVGNSSSTVVEYPAGLPGVIGVASVETNDVLSSYSSYGPTVDVVAPGSSVKSSYPTSQYAQWSGTSFAAPFVSAEAGILLEMDGELTPAQVETAIQAAAHPVDSLNPQYAGMLGAGLIDIQVSALELLESEYASSNYSHGSNMLGLSGLAGELSSLLGGSGSSSNGTGNGNNNQGNN